MRRSAWLAGAGPRTPGRWKLHLSNGIGTLPNSRSVRPRCQASHVPNVSSTSGDDGPGSVCDCPPQLPIRRRRSWATSQPTPAFFKTTARRQFEGKRNPPAAHCAASTPKLGRLSPGGRRLQRLLVDGRLPLVRRLVHCLRFCTLLEQCKWNRVATESIAELIGLLEQAACDEVGQIFEDRQPPCRVPRGYFVDWERILFDVTLEVGRPAQCPIIGEFSTQRSTCTDGKPGARAASQFPAIDLDRLERPLGPLTGDVLQPLNRFFESHAVSKRYTLVRPANSVVESVRRLTFAFPMSLWMLRWLAAEREPVADDLVQIVVALERGLELPALIRAAGYLAESGQLERLIAWYSR